MQAIWIADDDVDDVYFYQEALIKLKVTRPVKVFHSGQSVWDWLQASGERPALLILDGHMPEMSGLELINRLTALSSAKQFSIVVLTGTLSPAEAAIASKANVSVYPKPVTMDHLQALFGLILQNLPG